MLLVGIGYNSLRQCCFLWKTRCEIFIVSATPQAINGRQHNKSFLFQIQ